MPVCKGFLEKIQGFQFRQLTKILLSDSLKKHQTKENIDTQSTESTHLREGGSTNPKIWNHTTSWKNGDSSPPTSPTQQTSETLSGRIELFDNEKPNKKTKKSKLCLIL